jgi:DNA-binding NtrC family response regulator
MICDIRLPKLDGLTLFRRARQESPDTTIILMTAYVAVSDAVAAVKEGAHDYLTKPLDVEELTLRIHRIAEHRALLRELDDARAQLATRDSDEAIVGRSPQMLKLLDRINTIATSHAPVLVHGESGTGKELVARALHDRGPRRGKAFVAVNCAAFPDTLLEAELFGHERGAFTGAIKRRDGRFRAAHGGTLLLDEVAEMSLPAQAKLLRVLQEGTVEPLGTNESVRVDVRVVSATHRGLKERIAAGLFREDLYYRLNVLNVDIPPLRDRKGDLPLLVQYYLRKLTKPGKSTPRVSPAAWIALAEYPFPGNVRQLGHAVEHAMVLAGGADLEVHHLPREIARAGEISRATAPVPRPLGTALKEFEREYLHRALAQAEGKRTLAAEILGISRKNLWEKLRMHGMGD